VPGLDNGRHGRGRRHRQRPEVVDFDHHLVAAGPAEHDRAEAEHEEHAERGGQARAVVVHARLQRH